MVHTSHPLGWGKVVNGGAEIWDAKPVFLGDRVTARDWLKLLFYPKKWMLYGWVNRQVRKNFLTRTPPSPSPTRGGDRVLVPRILDVGCGTGAAVIDLKKIFGRSADVVGVDVVRLQVDIAREKIKQHGVWAEAEWFDGMHLPFPDASFDAVYTSDVLGHVSDVPLWLNELSRVLKPGGALAMFSESALGGHAWIRQYLCTRGLNVDPHAEFHISLYSKSELKNFLEDAGFDIKKMYTAFWASFFVHPDEFYEKLQAAQPKFPTLRFINRTLYAIKKRLYPYSTAAAELYGLMEMYIVGRWVEAQGYVILARKKMSNS